MSAKSTSTKLKSATTEVNVASATAPSSGQVLTATSSTAATWQTPGGASGIGFSLKSYSTAAAATSITVSSLDLVTDIKYRVTVMCIPTGGTNTGIDFLINNTTTGYTNFTNTMSATGTSTDAEVNTPNTSTTAALLHRSATPALYLQEYEIDLMVQKIDGTTTYVAYHGTGSGWSTTSRANISFAGMSTQTTLTSLKFQTLNDNSNTCDWKVWVHKLTTS